MPQVQALERDQNTMSQAYDLFDALEPVTPDDLLGDWEGAPFPTGHPMDGALEATGWRGKRFEGVDEVHPLLFHDGVGGVFAVHPGRFMSGRFSGKAADHREALETDRYGARLRQVLHRGGITTAMVYDDLPIIDLFKRVDPDTLLGVMDMRGMSQPYFFILRRLGA